MHAKTLSTSGAVLLALALNGCGGSDGSGGGPTSPSESPGAVAATITIGASGVSPRDVTVSVGSRVTFVNNDSRTREIASDPHPTHRSCPGLDQVGAIPAGQSRTSGNLNTARACTYHDHLDDTNTAVQGTIRVQ